MSCRTAQIGRQIGLCVLALGVLAGCASGSGDTAAQSQRQAEIIAKYPYGTDPHYMDGTLLDNELNSPGGKSPSLLADIFSLGKSNTSNSDNFIGVNTFLWHASLDTVSFMPLASADPFGGTIITDWYSPPKSPNERFKINIFILSRDLRANGVRARVFRQVKNANGQWVDAGVGNTTDTDIENAILTRARQIRMSTVAQQ